MLLISKELDLLHTLVIDYLRDYHDDTEAQVILDKLKIMKSTINISHDDYSE